MAEGQHIQTWKWGEKASAILITAVFRAHDGPKQIQYWVSGSHVEENALLMTETSKDTQVGNHISIGIA